MTPQQKLLREIKQGEMFHIGTSPKILYTKPLNGPNPVTSPPGRVHCVGFITKEGSHVPSIVTLVHFSEETIVHLVNSGPSKRMG